MLFTLFQWKEYHRWLNEIAFNSSFLSLEHKNYCTWCLQNPFVEVWKWAVGGVMRETVFSFFSFIHKNNQITKGAKTLHLTEWYRNHSDMKSRESSWNNAILLPIVDQIIIHVWLNQSSILVFIWPFPALKWNSRLKIHRRGFLSLLRHSSRY